jgi:hypothetical protein
MQNRTEYQDLLKHLSGGKLVHGSRYLHVTHPSAQSFLNWLAQKEFAPDSKEQNVLRLGQNDGDLGYSVSYYEKFFEDPFPALVWSQKYGLDLGPMKKRYEGKNPAILHRKELLLSIDHPRKAEYQSLTDALENEGVLPAKQFIGRREHWKDYLESLGYSISKGNLVKG